MLMLFIRIAIYSKFYFIEKKTIKLKSESHVDISI